MMWRRAGLLTGLCDVVAPRLSSVPTLAKFPSTFSSFMFKRGMFGQTFDVQSMEVRKRAEFEMGTRASVKLRAQQLIPGVLYGPKMSGGKAETVPIILPTSEVRRWHLRLGSKLENTLFDVTLDGEVVRCLPRDIQIHPGTLVFCSIFRAPSQFLSIVTVSREVISMNFMRYHPNTAPGARIEIPFKTINEDRSPGLKEGGWVYFLRFALPVYANGEVIPDCLIVDMRGKKLGDKIRASEIHLNEGLRLRSEQKDMAIAKVVKG